MKRKAVFADGGIGAASVHAGVSGPHRSRNSSDKVLLWVSLVLLFFGLAMVYSASMVMAQQEYGNGFYYFLRQAVFAVGGIALMLGGMKINYRKLAAPKLLLLMLALALAALLVVLLFPAVNGARRWIRFAGITLQPSEFVKVLLVIFVAAHVSRRQEVINDWRRGLLPCLSIVGLFAFLILREPDLGTSGYIVLTTAILLFAAGLRLSYLIGAALAAIPASYVLVFSSTYRRNRMLAFLNPFEDPQGIGYQVRQSLIAVGSGGWTGMGLADGKQKLFFLPMPHTDFIYAVIGEELGLWGCTLVLLLFGVFFWRGLRIALRAPDVFGRYVALGLTCMVVLQALINVSVVLSLVPNKGLPLPLISMGGSSLMATLLSVGLLLNISSQLNDRIEP